MAYNQIKWRPPGATAYTTLTSSHTVAPGLGGTDGHPYQASVVITSQVVAAGNGTYWVGDMQAATGADRYAGWSLVLAYRNPQRRCATCRSSEGSPTSPPRGATTA